MANTWRSTVQAAGFAAYKNMIDVFNAASSVRVIRIYRIYAFNTQASAVTGAYTTLQIRRMTSIGTGTTITPIAHNTAYAALDSGTTSGTARGGNITTNFRQLLWSNDEPVVRTLDIDALECLVPFAEIWNMGYLDNTIAPLSCRAGVGEGVVVTNYGTSAQGAADFEIEFTDASS